MTTRRIAFACRVFALFALSLPAVVPCASAADAGPKVVRIGYLAQYPPLVPATGAALIVQELGNLGYVEGKNLIVEVRHGGGDLERLPEAAAELVKLNVDVIFAVTNPAAFAAQRATRKTPIVAWAMHGAVEVGLVPSLRRRVAI